MFTEMLRKAFVKALRKIFRKAFKMALDDFERRFQAQRLYFIDYVYDSEPVECLICGEESQIKCDNVDNGWIDMRIFGRSFAMCPECFGTPQGQIIIKMALGCPNRINDIPS